MHRGLLSVSLFLIFLLTGCISTTSNHPSEPFLLIDPGHGGFDGGAVAKDGTVEKDINLDISLCLRDLLYVCGVSVSLTRDTDVSTHTLESGSIHEKKVSDLQNRLAMYEKSSFVISIHQNHFQMEKYHGAQVFYSGKNENSVHLATAVQEAIVQLCQPDNARSIKTGTDGIYLLYHTTVPAILVECGFMSNPNELQMLQQSSYRQKMAWSIMCGYWAYIKEK